MAASQQGIGAKQIGFLLIAIAVALALLFLSSTDTLKKAEDAQCTTTCGPNMPAGCPHENNLPIQSYAGFSVAIILAGIGAYMVNSGRKYNEELTEKEKKIERTVSTLGEDERKIFNMIKGADGAILQSDLLEKSGFTKVKVSRVLDKLEGRGLVERRRRGMTNLVLVRQGQ